jgi:hypothetical protein
MDRFINQRGDGKGMKPFWREAGITHPGRGFNIGEDREFIKWGRIFSGRPSYVNWQREGLLCNGGVTCRITYQVWENQGEGGTSQKGLSFPKPTFRPMLTVYKVMVSSGATQLVPA